jgi:hypothetical protein
MNTSYPTRAIELARRFRAAATLVALSAGCAGPPLVRHGLTPTASTLSPGPLAATATHVSLSDDLVAVVAPAAEDSSVVVVEMLVQNRGNAPHTLEPWRVQLRLVGAQGQERVAPAIAAGDDPAPARWSPDTPPRPFAITLRPGDQRRVWIAFGQFREFPLTSAARVTLEFASPEGTQAATLFQGGTFGADGLSVTGYGFESLLGGPRWRAGFGLLLGGGAAYGAEPKGTGFAQSWGLRAGLFPWSSLGFVGGADVVTVLVGKRSEQDQGALEFLGRGFVGLRWAFPIQNLAQGAFPTTRQRTPGHGFVIDVGYNHLWGDADFGNAGGLTLLLGVPWL